jgi:hypothetical protein
MPTAADFEEALHREIGAFRYDPLGFVLFNFPGGARRRNKRLVMVSPQA